MSAENQESIRRVAAIYDIHGNLPALEAVLEDVRGEQVDLVIVGGDVTLGPMPNETLRCLFEFEIPVQFLRGNCEVAVLAEIAGTDSGYKLPEQVMEAVRWTATRLDLEDQRLLASWPQTIRVAIPVLGEVLFCHATPRNEFEVFTRLTPEERLLPVFDELDVSIAVCGHTHMQFDRTVGSIRVVNAGSVGMPFGEPGAYWALLGPDVRLRCATYDLAKAAGRLSATSYPQASKFAEDIQRPRSESEMLELFSKAELR